MERFVKRVSLVCITDGSYIVTLVKEREREVFKILEKKCKILEKIEGLLTRFKYNDIEIEYLNGSGKLIVRGVSRNVRDILRTLLGNSNT